MGYIPSEKVAVIATIDPASQGVGASTSDWANAKYFQKVMAILQVGTLGTAATVDFKLQQATDASGTGAKDITGAAITQLTKAGTDDNKQAIINLNPESLDVANGFTFVAMVSTVGAAASLTSAVLHGLEPAYGPASDNDLASVDEIVTA